MGTRYNVTFPTTLVLQAIADGARYGFQIADVTGLQTGTVYPILRRLERLDFVRAAWEREALARDERRPARRYYRLTAAGRSALAQALERLAGAVHAIRKTRHA